MFKVVFLFAMLGITDLFGTSKVYPIAIVGAGAGGTMAAKRAVLNNREVLLFTGAKKEMKRSRGHWVRKVENIPGLEKYTRTINQLRDEVLKELKGKLSVIEDSVMEIQKQEDGLFKLTDKAKNSYLARYVILATGMMDEQPHIQGSIRPVLAFANKQTIAYCLLCDGHRSAHKNSVVIGATDEAAEVALTLADRYAPKTLHLLTNGQVSTITPEIAALLQKKKIEIIQEPIRAILGKKKGILSGFEFENGKKIDAEMAFVMLGVRPNNALALSLGAQVDERGLVVTDKKGESSVPNLFVIGDLRSKSMKQIYTAWQHAIDSLQVIDQRLRE